SSQHRALSALSGRFYGGFRVVPGASSAEREWDRCAFITTKGTNGADNRHHHVPHQRRLAWLVGGRCPAALDVRDRDPEGRRAARAAPAGRRRGGGPGHGGRP